MENTVTITLSRYHDLWEKENEFEERFQKEFNLKQTEWAKGENELAARYKQSYERESYKNIRLSHENSDLMQENVSLTNEVVKLKNQIKRFETIIILLVAVIVFKVLFEILNSI